MKSWNEKTRKITKIREQSEVGEVR